MSTLHPLRRCPARWPKRRLLPSAPRTTSWAHLAGSCGAHLRRGDFGVHGAAVVGGFIGAGRWPLVLAPSGLLFAVFFPPLTPRETWDGARADGRRPGSRRVPRTRGEGIAWSGCPRTRLYRFMPWAIALGVMERVDLVLRRSGCRRAGVVRWRGRLLPARAISARSRASARRAEGGDDRRRGGGRERRWQRGCRAARPAEGSAAAVVARSDRAPRSMEGALADAPAARGGIICREPACHVRHRFPGAGPDLRDRAAGLRPEESRSSAARSGVPCASSGGQRRVPNDHRDESPDQ